LGFLVSGDKIVFGTVPEQIQMRVLRDTDLVIPERKQTQSTSHLVDPFAERLQLHAFHFILVVVLMVAAIGEMDIDRITAGIPP
jgi:hypothetical protein